MIFRRVILYEGRTADSLGRASHVASDTAFWPRQYHTSWPKFAIIRPGASWPLSARRTSFVKSTALPALIVLLPIVLYAQMPRSWVGSPKTTMVRLLVNIDGVIRMGTWGVVSVLPMGRRSVWRPRSFKRDNTVFLVHSACMRQLKWLSTTS